VIVLDNTNQMIQEVTGIPEMTEVPEMTAEQNLQL
jgi:hypothetical protein